MKVSLSWISEFTDVQLPVDQLVEKIGAQLGAVDEVIDLGKRYKEAYIVKVVRCDKHSDADKLSVCWIDDGNKAKNIERNEEGLIQVVCGAPNVTAGMLAVWLPPGSVVPSTVDKDPLTLQSREIRGVTSNGMLASAKELDISEAHEGILVVDHKANPGDSFAQIYKLDDYIIDIENKMFTHRPDLFGMLGVAREIAGISGIKFNSPSWYLEPNKAWVAKDNHDLEDLKVDNQITDLVPRFMAIALSNVTIGPSPTWLQIYLTKHNLRPINNVVDITNYLMLLTGQPTHAYDYDKLKALSGGQAALVVRRGLVGEKLTLLNGKEILLDEQSVIIATPSKAVGLGGVMGGADTQVGEHTKNIVFECANFEMNVTRKTAMKYGLFTDAVTRFTKGQSPLQNPVVTALGINLIKEMSGAKVSSDLIDSKREDLASSPPVIITSSFVNSRLGLNLEGSQMRQLLENVEFNVQQDEDKLTILPPFWRTDIEIPEDIVEEVGRLYGYEHLPNDLPTRSIKSTDIAPKLKFKSQIRGILSSGGANEVLTYSFVDGSLLEHAGQDKQQSFHIKNALSPALQYYRQSIAPSLLQKVHSNIKMGFENFAIFEMGKGHIKKDYQAGTLPNEMDIVGFVYIDSRKKVGNDSAYYCARRYLDYLCQDNLQIGLSYEPIESDLEFSIAKPYQPGRAALIKVAGTDEMLGIIGEYKSSLITSFKLPLSAAGFELDLDVLSKINSIKSYVQLNKYPEISQDITLKTDFKVRYSELTELILKELNKISNENGYIYRVRFLGIYQKPEAQQTKNTTWRIALSHPDKTLITQEVNEVFDMIERSAGEKFNAERL